MGANSSFLVFLLATNYTDVQHSDHPTSVRQPRHEADHSFLTSAEVRLRGGCLHFPTLHVALLNE